jgi:hypothetical protein
MKIKVKKVLSTRSIPKKDGSGNFTKTQFLTEADDVLDTFGSVEVGQEYEGEVEENQYGKTFKKANSGFKGGFQRQPADPDTMLISYAKDLVVAFINAGKIKSEEVAGKQVRNFSELMFGLYKAHKNGKTVVSKVEVQDEAQDETHEKPENEEQQEIDEKKADEVMDDTEVNTDKKDEINLADIPL